MKIKKKSNKPLQSGNFLRWEQSGSEKSVKNKNKNKIDKVRLKNSTNTFKTKNMFSLNWFKSKKDRQKEQEIQEKIRWHQAI